MSITAPVPCLCYALFYPYCLEQPTHVTRNVAVSGWKKEGAGSGWAFTLGNRTGTAVWKGAVGSMRDGAIALTQARGALRLPLPGLITGESRMQDGFRGQCLGSLMKKAGALQVGCRKLGMERHKRGLCLAGPVWLECSALGR